ncbi:hypothetical protein VTK26DRAFT_8435 [Humicola hyalothermophila]
MLDERRKMSEDSARKCSCRSNASSMQTSDTCRYSTEAGADDEMPVVVVYVPKLSRHGRMRSLLVYMHPRLRRVRARICRLCLCPLIQSRSVRVPYLEPCLAQKSI